MDDNDYGRTGPDNGNGMETFSPLSSAQYTFPGVLHYLQSQWRIFERERISWDLEKADYLARIRFLESERKAVLVLRNDMMKRIRLLENALIQERSKNGNILESNNNIDKNVGSNDSNVSPSQILKDQNIDTKNENYLNTHSKDVLRAYLHELSTILPQSNASGSNLIHGRNVSDAITIPDNNTANQVASANQHRRSHSFAANAATATTASILSAAVESSANVSNSGPRELDSAFSTVDIDQEVPKSIKAQQAISSAPIRGHHRSPGSSEIMASNVSTTLNNSIPNVSTDGSKSLPNNQKVQVISMDLDDDEDDEDEKNKNSTASSSSSSRSKRLVSGLTSGLVSEDDDVIWKPKVTIRNHLAAVRSCIYLPHPVNSIDSLEKTGPLGSKDINNLSENWTPPSSVPFDTLQPSISLITGSDDFTLKAWDVTSVYIPLQGKNGSLQYKSPSDPEPIHVFRGHVGPITSIDYLIGILSKKGETEEHIYSASIDGTIKVWRFPLKKRVHNFDKKVDKHGTAKKNGIPVSNEREVWATYNPYDGSLDDIKAEEIYSYNAHSDSIWSIQVRSNGKDKPPTLYSLGSDFKLKIWEAGTNKRSLISTLELSKEFGYPTSFELLKDLYPNDSKYATQVVIGFEDGKLRLYDLKSLKLLSTLEYSGENVEQSPIRDIALHTEKGVLLSAHSDAHVRIWDVKLEKSIGKPVLAHQAPCSSVEIISNPDGGSNNGKRLGSVCTSSTDGSVRWWSLEKTDEDIQFTCTLDYPTHARVGGEGVTSLAISNWLGDKIDGYQTRKSWNEGKFNRLNVLAAAGADGQVKLFRIGGNKTAKS